jgi:hypothetical protein
MIVPQLSLKEIIPQRDFLFLRFEITNAFSR